jgi:hypothetical protein
MKVLPEDKPLVELLTPEDARLMLLAIFSEPDDIPELTPTAKIAFTAITLKSERLENWNQDLSSKRSESGKKGADKRWKSEQPIANDGNLWQPIANDSNLWQPIASVSPSLSVSPSITKALTDTGDERRETGGAGGSPGKPDEVVDTPPDGENKTQKLENRYGGKETVDTCNTTAEALNAKDSAGKTEDTRQGKTEDTPRNQANFETFWAAYPRKVGKAAAAKAWRRIKPGKELQAKILAAISSAMASADWRRDGGRYVPNPSTWLNQGRWDDVLKPASEGETKKSGKEKNNGAGSDRDGSGRSDEDYYVANGFATRFDWDDGGDTEEERRIFENIQQRYKR